MTRFAGIEVGGGGCEIDFKGTAVCFMTIFGIGFEGGGDGCGVGAEVDARTRRLGCSFVGWTSLEAVAIGRGAEPGI